MQRKAIIYTLWVFVGITILLISQDVKNVESLKNKMQSILRPSIDSSSNWIDQNEADLNGVTLYLLEAEYFYNSYFGVNVPDNVKEFEIKFISKDEVLIKVVACYECGVNVKSKTESVNYKYMYSHNVLQVMNTAIKFSITAENSKYLATSEGFVLYKTSITKQSQEEKKVRLNQCLNYPSNIKDFLSDEKIIY